MLREVPPPIANPENGEVLLQVKGPNGEVREAFVLRMGANAACQLEEAMGEHIHKIGARLSSPGHAGMRDLRCLLHACLNEHHPLMTQKDAGNLLDRVGFDAAAAALIKTFTLGFPKPPTSRVAVAAEAETGNGLGTGSGSSPTQRKRGSAQRSSGQ